jgi:hypothetical protein
MLTRDVTNPFYLYFLGGFVEGEGSNSVSISALAFAQEQKYTKTLNME